VLVTGFLFPFPFEYHHPLSFSFSFFCFPLVSNFIILGYSGKKDGTLDVSAWQVSDQCAGLVRDGVIHASKEPSKFRVRTSNSETLYPDIFYGAKDEYGYQVLRKADPLFPVDFCIVSVRSSSVMRLLREFEELV
jgi:hypothetical protein